MKLRRHAAVVAFVALPGLVGPSRAQQTGKENPAEPAKVQTVNVFAAASLTAAFQAMGVAFEKAHDGVTVQLNFAGSPTLVEQIRQGAPVDVFASADEANMQKLIDAGQVAGAAQIFARNTLQIVVAAGNPKRIEGLADLAKAGLVVVLCAPTVPCGRYAAEAFGTAGVAVPASSQELDVKAVLSKVVLGEADAGIVYVTDVRAAGGKVHGVDIPESVNVTARYPIATVKNAANATTAAVFIEFVLSSEGQQLLARFGFLPR